MDPLSSVPLARPPSRPWRHRLELRQIECVLEICDAGSFSAAARNLRLSQPALSKSISRMEAQVGARLFHRSGGLTRPTELGQLIAEDGRGILAASDALGRRLKDRGDGESGLLRIGVGPTTRLRPLPQVVRGLLLGYPDLRLDIRLDDGHAIMSGVSQGRYDIAFGYSENAEPYGDLVRAKIFDDDTIVVVRPDHPAASAQTPLTAVELLEYPMASVGINLSFGAWIGDLTEKQAANASAFVSNDVELMRSSLPHHYTMRGARFVFEASLRLGELVQLPLTWRSVYQCWMLTTAETWRLPLVKAVADIARAGIH